MSVVLIAGAATGIGRVTAETLVAARHTVYASMRHPGRRNVMTFSDMTREAFVRRLGFAGTLELKR